MIQQHIVTDRVRRISKGQRDREIDRERDKERKIKGGGKRYERERSVKMGME